jgi:hypothetical protein
MSRVHQTPCNHHRAVLHYNVRKKNHQPREKIMNNLDYVITWTAACEMFEHEVLPSVIETYEQDGIEDWPARREGWNNWTDSLCKDNQISDWPYENWSQSPLCGN